MSVRCAIGSSLLSLGRRCADFNLQIWSFAGEGVVVDGIIVVKAVVVGSIYKAEQ